jgi:hypothetical protein
MATPRLPEPSTSSAIATLGKRLLSYVVLIGVALLALKLVAGIVIGLVTTVATIIAVIALIIAAIWAARRL